MTQGLLEYIRRLAIEIYHEVETVEEHNHLPAYTFPEDLTSPVTVTTDTVAKTTAATGWGVWTEIATQAQLVTRFPNGTKYDPNLMMMIDATLNRQWDFQVGCGPNDAAVVFSGGGTFSSVGSANRNAPVEFRSARCLQNGTDNLYMRVASDNAAADKFDTRLEAHGPYTF